MASPDVVDTAAAGRGPRAPPLIVREPLEAFLDGQGLGSGPVEAERIGEGHSNVTYLVKRGGERFVLRRPPRPPLPPSAHDVLREARLLRALEATSVRVPRVLAACDDESVLGVPFYVMEEMHGRVITTEIPARSTTRRSAAASARSWSTRWSRCTPSTGAACGLEGYGKPTGYLERQLRRFSGLWEYNKTRELPVVEEVARLARRQPARVAASRRSCTATTGSAT